MAEAAGLDELEKADGPWSWSESLGGADVGRGQAYEVRRIVFDLVKERCAELGLEPGITVRCRKRDHGHIMVELSDGTMVPMELAYARFVEVEAVQSPLDLSRRA